MRKRNIKIGKPTKDAKIISGLLARLGCQLVGKRELGINSKRDIYEFISVNKKQYSQALEVLELHCKPIDKEVKNKGYSRDGLLFSVTFGTKESIRENLVNTLKDNTDLWVKGHGRYFGKYADLLYQVHNELVVA